MTTAQQPLLGADAADLRWVDPQLLDLDEPQPRQDYDPTADAELAANVREQGVLVPLLVVAQPAGRYLVLAGARRRNAALAAEVAGVPCMVLAERPGARAWLDYQLIENLHRRELSPLELAQTIWRRWLLANIAELERERGEDGSATDSLVQAARTPAAQIAQLQDRLASLAGVASVAAYLAGGQVRVSRRAVLEQLGLGGRSESWAKKQFGLLKLDPAVQEALEGADVSAATLHELAQHEPAEQEALVERAKDRAKGSGGKEGGTGAGGKERAKGKAEKATGVGAALRKELDAAREQGQEDADQQDENEEPADGGLLDTLAPGRSSFTPDPQLAFPSGPSGHASKLVTNQVAPERGSAPPTRPVGIWSDDQVIQAQGALEALATICDDAGVLRLDERQIRRLQPHWGTAVAALDRAGLRVPEDE